MKLQVRTALVLAVVALVAALTGVGTTLATQRLITGKQIKNNSIASVDLKNNGVQTADIANGTVDSEDLGANSVGSEEIQTNAVGSEELAANAVGSEEIAPGAVHSSDIGDNQVTSEDVDLPEPEQIVTPPEAPDMVGNEYALVDEVGSYIKEDPTSGLSVSWTGSAAAGFSPCLFQIRVDGTASANGAGVIYVANGSTISVSGTALFEGLGTGPHAIQVWAHSTINGSFPCTVGPVVAGVDQTFVVSEEVG
jgi:hypothetical protein